MSYQGIPAYRYIVTTINTDPFTYNMTLYYTSIKFIGVIIDTRASKYYMAGYGQFLTFQRLDISIQLDTSIQGIG